VFEEAEKTSIVARPTHFDGSLTFIATVLGLIGLVAERNTSTKKPVPVKGKNKVFGFLSCSLVIVRSYKLGLTDDLRPET